MSFDFSTLITTRSQSDVDALRALISRGKDNWTAEELAEFNLARSRGAYNYTDLNRVTACMEYLNEQLRGYGYQTGYSRITIPHDAVSALPDGYTELEYIESSGTQYVDTKVVPDGDTVVYMDFQLTNPDNTNQCLFGTAGQFSFRWFGSQGYFRSNGKENSNFPKEIDKAARHTVEKTATACTIDQSYTVSNTAGDVTLSLTLFGQHGATDILNFADVKCYSIEIYSGDELVRNYIPCKNPSGEVGLYDLVGQQFYGNAGTGNFIGSPVPVELPDGYTQVEYIESSGTQFIDTNASMPNGFRAEIDIEFTSVGSSLMGVIGAHNLTSPYGRNYLAAKTGFFEMGLGDGLHDFGSPIDGKRYSIDFCNIYQNQYCEIDGVDQPLSGSGVSDSYSSATLYIFSVHDGDVWFTKCSSKLYGLKLYDTSEELIRDFIPCKDPSNEVGLYDTVNGQFYGNSGTGIFTAGSEIENEPTEEMDPYTWYESDIPTESLMTAYLSNIEAIRSTLEVLFVTPETPESMEALTWVEANNIEQILIDINQLIINMSAAWFFSGDLYSGEAEA